MKASPGDADDSENSTSLSDPTAFLNSGEEDLTLDVRVICAIEVEVAAPFTICSTQPIDLTQDASITPTSLGGTWSTPDGTGEFTTGMDFATATTYIPSSADALRGSVTLILTTNDPEKSVSAIYRGIPSLPSRKTSGVPSPPMVPLLSIVLVV
jgi:hypothetical protein